jgi:hypothetical protein
MIPPIRIHHNVTVNSPQFDAYLSRSLPIGELPALPVPHPVRQPSFSNRDAKMIGLGFAAALPALAITAGVAISEKDKRP